MQPSLLPAVLASEFLTTELLFLHYYFPIAAYSFLPKKPSIKNDIEETNPAFIEAFPSQLNLAA
jgi:hypothetical protein